MIFKYRYRVGPGGARGHTHIRMFAGENEDALGLCGTLIMRNEEWSNFVDMHIASAVFVARDGTTRSMNIYDCRVTLQNDTAAESETSLPLDLP